jgi:hypothetical protein
MSFLLGANKNLTSKSAACLVLQMCRDLGFQTFTSMSFLPGSIKNLTSKSAAFADVPKPGVPDVHHCVLSVWANKKI